MGRRRINRTDRNGDPLDGVVNLFDVAIDPGGRLSAGGPHGHRAHRDPLVEEGGTIVTNPGQSDMQVITKKGTQITKLNLKGGQQVSGVGTLIGQFYRLPDGTTVYVPSAGSAAGQNSDTSSTTTPGVAVHAHASRRRDHPDPGHAPDRRPRHDPGARSRRRHHPASSRSGGAPRRYFSERRSATSRSSSSRSRKRSSRLPPRLPVRIRTGTSRSP